jgi:hypothetical protein
MNIWCKTRIMRPFGLVSSELMALFWPISSPTASGMTQLKSRKRYDSEGPAWTTYENRQRARSMQLKRSVSLLNNPCYTSRKIPRLKDSAQAFWKILAAISWGRDVCCRKSSNVDTAPDDIYCFPRIHVPGGEGEEVSLGPWCLEQLSYWHRVREWRFRS